jgi:hypothetical protein
MHDVLLQSRSEADPRQLLLRASNGKGIEEVLQHRSVHFRYLTLVGSGEVSAEEQVVRFDAGELLGHIVGGVLEV